LFGKFIKLSTEPNTYLLFGKGSQAAPSHTKDHPSSLQIMWEDQSITHK